MQDFYHSLLVRHLLMGGTTKKATLADKAGTPPITVTENLLDSPVILRITVMVILVVQVVIPLTILTEAVAVKVATPHLTAMVVPVVEVATQSTIAMGRSVELQGTQHIATDPFPAPQISREITEGILITLLHCSYD